MSMTIPPLVLASASPRRRALFRQIGLRFRVVPSSVDERLSRKQSPARNARRIALEKATDVASGMRRGLVVGADTIVVLGKSILGKPKNRRDAARMLRRLSGRSHVVFTGIALVDALTGRAVTDVVRTRVQFRRLSDAEIADYVRSGSPLDKAGAYGIQDDFGAVFVESIDGCFYNVVGFPLVRFYQRLGEFLSSKNTNTKDRAWKKRKRSAS
jgi:septum formation protein